MHSWWQAQRFVNLSLCADFGQGRLPARVGSWQCNLEGGVGLSHSYSFVFLETRHHFCMRANPIMQALPSSCPCGTKPTVSLAKESATLTRQDQDNPSHNNDNHAECKQPSFEQLLRPEKTKELSHLCQQGKGKSGLLVKLFLKFLCLQAKMLISQPAGQQITPCTKVALQRRQFSSPQVSSSSSIEICSRSSFIPLDYKRIT